MELLNEKYKQVCKALKTLEIAVNKFENFDEYSKSLLNDPDAKNMVRDSMIQRFEYSFDVIWNYLKLYLEHIGIKPITIKGSRTVFRACFKAGLISEEQTRKAIEMIDVRNRTVHTYDEKKISALAEHIPSYYKLVQCVIDSVKPD